MKLTRFEEKSHIFMKYIQLWTSRVKHSIFIEHNWIHFIIHLFTCQTAKRHSIFKIWTYIGDHSNDLHSNKCVVWIEMSIHHYRKNYIISLTTVLSDAFFHSSIIFDDFVAWKLVSLETSNRSDHYTKYSWNESIFLKFLLKFNPWLMVHL